MRVAVLNRPGEIELVERPEPRARAGRGAGAGHRGRSVRVRHPLLRPRTHRQLRRRGPARAGPRGERRHRRRRRRCRRRPGRAARLDRARGAVPLVRAMPLGPLQPLPDMRFHATPPIDGSLAELVVTHEAFAHPVPDSVSRRGRCAARAAVGRHLVGAQGAGRRRHPGARDGCRHDRAGRRAGRPGRRGRRDHRRRRQRRPARCGGGARCHPTVNPSSRTSGRLWARQPPTSSSSAPATRR